MKDYACSQCGETFTSDRSDEAARAEQRADFPGVPDEACAVVCDDCYQELQRAGVLRLRPLLPGDPA